MSSQGRADEAPVKDVTQSIGSHNEQDELPELTKAQAKRLLLKTDLVVMPLAVLSMTLAFLDKVETVSSNMKVASLTPYRML
jgi:hypothetical protein